MKILVLNTNIGYGGASKMLTFVANTLGNAGNEVIYLTYRDSAVLQPVSAAVKHRHIVTEEKGTGLFGTIRTIKYLHGALKREKFDVAIAFLSPSQLRLALASRFTKTRVIFSHRADPYTKLKQNGMKFRFADFLNSIAFRMADYFVFQTKMARDYYPESIRIRSTVIANPINILVRTKERNVDTIRKSIVTVGRHEIKQKRQDVLIEAFNIFNTTHPDYLLEIYGDGEDGMRVEELAKSNPNIQICGATRQVAERIQNAAMFVLSSDYEGIPNALLEAMSLGVPCISTDCSPGGASMLIDSKEKGLIVNCGDAKALANAMAYMADNSEEAELMGKNGMSVNIDYASGIIANKWLKVITRNSLMC